MKKRIFFGAATLLFAVGAVVATQANAPAPDYYINDLGACVVAPNTDCLAGTPSCIRTVSGQSTPKQFYDIRVNNTCQVTLQEVQP